MANEWNAIVWVKWRPQTPTTAWESWKGNPSIREAWTTQGEWDCCLLLNVNDHDKLEEFVWRHVRTNQWVENTRTMWVKKWW